MDNKTITIFGSSSPLPGEREYEFAYELGKKLAEENINDCTGGAMGIMDAASKGAKENGTEAIGVTVDIFGSKTSTHLTKEVKCNTLFERIDNLIHFGDGFIILPGGTGTLVELAIAWELINKNINDPKPICTFGKPWQNIVEAMEDRLVIEKKQNGLVKHFDEVDPMVSFIAEKLK